MTEPLRAIFDILVDQGVAEFLEHQVFLISPDWPTYLINVWLVGSRILEPDIVRARQQGADLVLGRWSSEAFLKYIRRQVQEFTTGVSARMIQRGSFFNVPHAHSTAHREDPRTPGCRHSFASAHGTGFMRRGASMPPFNLFT